MRLSLRRRRSRRGFALTIALWLIVMLGTVTAGSVVVARDAVRTAENRVGLARARWIANGCANEAIARLDARLTTPDAWERLDDDAIAVSPVCDVSLRPAGMTLNVNQVDDAHLGAALDAAGLPPPRAESLAAAIADWRDGDRVARDAGGEREWYERAGRLVPRDAPFLSARELTLVRGADALPELDALFDVADDPVVLARASRPVLSGLRGLSSDAIDAIVAAQGERPFPGLARISQRLEGPARDELLAGYAELVTVATDGVMAWTLRVVATDPARRMESGLELRLVRDGVRAVVVRRREWP